MCKHKRARKIRTSNYSYSQNKCMCGYDVCSRCKYSRYIAGHHQGWSLQPNGKYLACAWDSKLYEKKDCFEPENFEDNFREDLTETEKERLLYLHHSGKHEFPG